MLQCNNLSQQAAVSALVADWIQGSKRQQEPARFVAKLRGTLHSQFKARRASNPLRGPTTQFENNTHCAVAFRVIDVRDANTNYNRQPDPPSTTFESEDSAPTPAARVGGAVGDAVTNLEPCGFAVIGRWASDTASQTAGLGDILTA